MTAIGDMGVGPSKPKVSGGLGLCLTWLGPDKAQGLGPPESTHHTKFFTNQLSSKSRSRRDSHLAEMRTDRTREC